MLRLRYDKGTLVVHASRPPTPHFRFDARDGVCRSLAREYASVVQALARDDVRYEDEVFQTPPVPLKTTGVRLREYQSAALDAWLAAQARGLVVLPTGAGKTVLALKALAAVGGPALVVVPTLDLLDQWQGRLAKAFPGVGIGAVARGETDLADVTVTTYDSAYIHAAHWGQRFRTVVFDEVHHLPSEGYRHIADMLPAPHRLGLTATPERADGLESLLPDLVGPVVYASTSRELAGEHLAPYVARRVYVDLSPEEREAYERHAGAYAKVLEARREFRGMAGHKRLIMRSGKDPVAREALLARERARDVMLNAPSKLARMEKILEQHRGERTIVFTEHNRLVHEISRRYLVPAITHVTPTLERQEILRRFRDGTYPVVVTSKVLDEGVDVPEARVGIILSGSGSRREFVQRLGRLLRKEEGKQARLYEIVSRGTREEFTSDRRGAGHRRRE